MTPSNVNSSQFWHFSQQRRGPERPVEGDKGEENRSHVGYVLRDGKWVPKTNG